MRGACFGLCLSALFPAGCPSDGGDPGEKASAEDVGHAGRTLPLETLGERGAGTASQTRKPQLPGRTWGRRAVRAKAGPAFLSIAGCDPQGRVLVCGGPETLEDPSGRRTGCREEAGRTGEGPRGGETMALLAGGGGPGAVRTRVGRAVGQRQVGAGPPGPGAEVLAAAAAVGARGVVLALALQAALAHGAQAGVQVALAPAGTRAESRGPGAGGVGRARQGPERPRPAPLDSLPGHTPPEPPLAEGSPLPSSPRMKAALGPAAGLPLVRGSRAHYVSAGAGTLLACGTLPVPVATPTPLRAERKTARLPSPVSSSTRVLFTHTNIYSQPVILKTGH